MNREKVINAIECCVESRTRCFDDKDKLCPYFSAKSFLCEHELLRDALALLKEQEDLGTDLTNAVELIHKKNERIEKLLKEHEEQKRAWLQSIADNQLANSPMGHEDEGQLRYKSGLWNGLQMAYEIITAGEKKDG